MLLVDLYNNGGQAVRMANNEYHAKFLKNATRFVRASFFLSPPLLQILDPPLV